MRKKDMKLYNRFKVKTIRMTTGVSVQVTYDHINNLNFDQATDFGRFPEGLQLEDDGVAFFWDFKEIKN